MKARAEARREIERMSVPKTIQEKDQIAEKERAAEEVAKEEGQDHQEVIEKNIAVEIVTREIIEITEIKEIIEIAESIAIIVKREVQEIGMNQEVAKKKMAEIRKKI